MSQKTSLSHLRSQARIQHAHDLITAILEEIPFDTDDIIVRDFYTALDVLCWALSHDHNQTFQKTLNTIHNSIPRGTTIHLFPSPPALQKERPQRDKIMQQLSTIKNATTEELAQLLEIDEIEALTEVMTLLSEGYIRQVHQNRYALIDPLEWFRPSTADFPTELTTL